MILGHDCILSYKKKLMHTQRAEEERKRYSNWNDKVCPNFWHFCASILSRKKKQIAKKQNNQFSHVPGKG